MSTIQTSSIIIAILAISCVMVSKNRRSIVIAHKLYCLHVEINSR